MRAKVLVANLGDGTHFNALPQAGRKLKEKLKLLEHRVARSQTADFLTARAKRAVNLCTALHSPQPNNPKPHNPTATVWVRE